MWKQYSHCSLACQLRSDKFFGTSCLVRVKCIHRLAARRLTALLTPASVVGLSLLLVVDEHRTPAFVPGWTKRGQASRSAQPAGGLRQESFRVGLACNPGTQERSPACAHPAPLQPAGSQESGRGRRHIPAHSLLRRVRDLDVGVIEGLLDAQRRIRHLPHQLLSGSRQVAQLLDGPGRYEAGPISPCANKPASHAASVGSKTASAGASSRACTKPG